MLALGRLVSGFPTGVLWRRRDYPVENRAAGKVTAAVADDWRHDDR